MNAIHPETSTPSIKNIVKMFQFPELKTHKNSIPKLNEDYPLTLYYHAEDHLKTAIKAFEKLNDISSTKFTKSINRIHFSQQLVLDCIFLIYNELDSNFKVNKDYRLRLPLEDQQELNVGFSENILFAAQAMINGFHIRGLENCTQELQIPALQLCASFEALRHVFRLNALSNDKPPYENLNEVLIDFDNAWSNFESQICDYYFNVLTQKLTENHPPNYDLFVNQLKSTLIDSIHSNLINQELVEELHSSIFVSIPRIFIFNLLLKENELINSENGYLWLNDHQSLLLDLQTKLSILSSQDIEYLKLWLSGCKDSSFQLQNVFNSICLVSDSLLSGPFSKPFLDCMNSTFSSLEDL